MRESGKGSLPVAFQCRFQKFPRVAAVARGAFLRRAGKDELAAAVAALGPEVDDVVGALDHIQIVLNDDHGVARVYEPLQHLHELVDVCHMQSGRRLVEDVYGTAGIPAGKLRGELDALRLAAGERR